MVSFKISIFVGRFKTRLGTISHSRLYPSFSAWTRRRSDSHRFCVRFISGSHRTSPLLNDDVFSNFEARLISGEFLAVRTLFSNTTVLSLHVRLVIGESDTTYSSGKKLFANKLESIFETWSWRTTPWYVLQKDPGGW